jgi:choice-of-anchor B domain-containing protein
MKHAFLLLTTLGLALISQISLAQTTHNGEITQVQGFGEAVEVANGNVFIGEPSNVQIPGAVYIFSKQEEEWTQKFAIKAEDGEVGDGFGSSLSAFGNLLMVGAPDKNDGVGGAYIFEESEEGSWSQLASLTVLSDSSLSSIGSSVALAEGYAFVGIPNFGNGAIAVFKDVNGNYVQESMIINPDTSQTNFGYSLDYDGTNLVVGAPSRNAGAAYIFTLENKEWISKATLSNSGLSERSFFAGEVAVHGDMAFVTAQNQDKIGTVFIYKNTVNGWISSGRLNPFDGTPWHAFGSSLAIGEHEVWVGAINSNEGKGSIYRFTMNEHGSWDSSSKLNATGESAGDYFGGSLAIDGNTAVTGLIGADYGAGTAAILNLDDTGEWTSSNIVIGENVELLQPITNGKVECEGGAANLFGCDKVNLISFLPISEVGANRGVMLNDIWGWTDPETGKEYALVGRSEGTSFVDLSDPSNPIYVGNLPMTKGARSNVWRDIKVFDNHAYIVADNAGEHGMQVLDLTRLRAYENEPLLLDEDAHYPNIHSAHNVVINEETGFAYIVGASGGGMSCGGGLHMVDINEPKNPTFAGCFADPSTGRRGTGYSHDAQCVIYDGPDTEHTGKEICVGANETAISVADVTDKSNPIALSTGSYPDYGYVHQGWFDETQTYFYQNDELDELNGTVEETRTIVWDLTDLDDPQVLTQYFNDNASSDHNLYIRDNLMYQSNYVSGLQVIDISEPENPQRVGFFDTFPFTKDAAGFSGTWSNYPYFNSGVVIMTSGFEGLFILETSPELINR